MIGTGSSGIQAIPVIAAAGRPSHRLPAHAELQRAGPQRPARPRAMASAEGGLRAIRRTSARIAGRHRAARSPNKSALEATPEERQARYERRWERGGAQLHGSLSRTCWSTRRPTTPPPSSSATRSARSSRTRRPPRCWRPTTYPSAPSGFCVDTDYYETFNRDNVDAGRHRARPDRSDHAERAAHREHGYELDAIVFATGFDAMTGALAEDRHPWPRRSTLQEKWAAGPRTYLGLIHVAGFPNLFTITGPGSPSVLCNMPVSIEQHVDWITDCIDHMRMNGLERIEARPEAQRSGCAQVNELANRTLLPMANIPGISAPISRASRGSSCRIRRCRCLPAEVRRNRRFSGYTGFSPGLSHAASGHAFGDATAAE